MDKIKNAIQRIGTDGLLHLLVCYVMVLTFIPLGFVWTSVITWSLAIGKEVYDIVRKTNNIKQVFNDITRDGIG